MKKINLISLFLVLLSLCSCSQSEYLDYTAPDELSDVSFVTNFRENANNINIDTHIAFFDLSIGAESHEWILEEGNSFLKTGFNLTDSLPKFIDNEAGIISNDPKAFVLFRKDGINKVRLLNKFKSYVSYKYNLGSVGTPIVKELKSVKQGDLWVIDTTFVYDVYGYIKPALRVLKGGNEVLNVKAEDKTSLANSASWPVIEVEAASPLTYEDITTVGRPNGGVWLTPDAVPGETSGKKIVEVKYYKLGTFNAGTLRSTRGNGLPVASVEKIIPLKIRVVKSSLPFVYDGALTEDATKTISFRVNGEVQDFIGKEGNFTVNVKNIAKGFNQNIPVQIARVKNSDKIFIELVLSAPIYNSDEITVSYNGLGDIMSADSRTLQAFGPEAVNMYYGVNILPNNGHSDFEQSITDKNRALATDYYVGPANGPEAGSLVWERITTRQQNGTASMQYKTAAGNVTPNVSLFSFGLGNPTAIPAGTYRMSYWIYIDPATTLKSFTTEFGNPITSTYSWNIESLVKGEWVQVFKTITVPKIESGYRMGLSFKAGDNAGVTGAQLVFFDNWAFQAVETRP
ncbi:hypothetical protein [Flavobacterium sp.]|uniref:hypothetical protein n=1 Tax=Flavobacterium sp. TaxID=239 RepID=UPI003C51F2D8